MNECAWRVLDKVSWWSDQQTVKKKGSVNRNVMQRKLNAKGMSDI